MTSFHFEAADLEGRTVRGLLDAPSGTAAAATLSRRGLFPVRVVEVSAVDQWRFRRPSRRSLALAVQSLASLTEAGMPLEQALMATTQVVTGSFRDALHRVASRVREGASLAAAMDAEIGLFPAVTIGILRGGEHGVGLEAALGQAALQLESEAESMARVRAALTYPLLLSAVGTVSIGLITFFVVPRFAELVAEADSTLPAATTALLGVSSFLKSYGLVIAGALVASAVTSAHLLARYPRAWHRWLLALPIVGGLRHGFATARAARTLGALFGSGTSALSALDVTAQSVGDFAVKERLAIARDRVAEGSALGSALQSVDAFTPMATRLVKIGEGSGKLSELLFKAATLEEQTAERRLKALVTILEPALILLFAAIVAFVAAALLQAIYSVRPGAL